MIYAAQRAMRRSTALEAASDAAATPAPKRAALGCVLGWHVCLVGNVSRGLAKASLCADRK